MATRTRCDNCGSLSTTAHRPLNMGTCNACWEDLESLDEAIDQINWLRDYGLLTLDELVD